jgi:hypothetical protein
LAVRLAKTCGKKEFGRKKVSPFTEQVGGGKSNQMIMKKVGTVVLKMPVLSYNSIHEIYTRRFCHYMV